MKAFQDHWDVVAIDMRGYNDSDKPEVFWERFFGRFGKVFGGILEVLGGFEGASAASKLKKHSLAVEDVVLQCIVPVL
jgi:pimeloyl-ACP methyl ester carboxylesterase